jgi:hypothetical protein
VTAPVLDSYITVDRACALSRSCFVPLIERRIATGDKPRPQVRTFQRFGDWYAIVSFPPMRHQPASRIVFLPLVGNPFGDA